MSYLDESNNNKNNKRLVTLANGVTYLKKDD